MSGLFQAICEKQFSDTTEQEEYCENVKLEVFKFANNIDRLVEKMLKRHEAAIQHQVDKHRAVERKRKEKETPEVIFKVIKPTEEVLVPFEVRKS